MNPFRSTPAARPPADRPRPGRRLIAFGVVCLWIATIGWKASRAYARPEAVRIAEAALARLGPEAHWYALRLGEVAIGSASSRLDTLEGGGFRLEDLLSLEMTALGQQGRAIARTRMELAPSLDLREFDFQLESDAGTFRALGEVEGDSLLSVRIESGGDPEELRFRLDELPIVAAALPLRVAMAGDLAVGQVFRFPIFDPSTLSTRTVEVEVMEHDTLSIAAEVLRDPEGTAWQVSREDPVPAWRLVERFGGVQVESWIDDRGRIVRSSSPMGFTMERVPREIAIERVAEAPDRGPLSDVLLNTAIASEAPVPDIPPGGAQRFLLSGVDLEGFELEGGRQQLRGDTLIVAREDWGALRPGYTLPYPSMDLRDALEPEPLIQSADPRIIEEARRIAGIRPFERPDPREVALRLNEGVHRMLRKSVTFSIPSALQVLESGAGDCNEHTVLFVALARSLGLPARTAVGIVHLDGRFFYHAWPEVWLGEWVAVDPTFGQLPASAAHLRFAIGGLAEQVSILRLLGRLRVEPLEADRRAEAA